MDYLDKKIKDSKNVIEESNVNNPSQIYANANKRVEKVNILKSNLFMKYAICCLLVVAITVGMISIFNKPNNFGVVIGNENSNLGVSEVYGNDIKNVTSVDEIKNLVLNASSSNVSTPGDSEVDEDFKVEVDSPTFESTSTGNIVTGTINPDINIDHIYNTNTQVANVDEGDIVKVNGDYIYYVTRAKYRYTYNSDFSERTKHQLSENCLYVLKANGDELEIVKKVTFEDTEEVVTSNGEAKVIEETSHYPIDVLYTDKYIILSVKTSTQSYVEFNSSKYYSNYKNYTEFYLYDVNTLEYKTNINVPGSVLTTRLIDNQLYIISNYTDYKKNNYEDLLPRFWVGDFEITASFSNIYYCPGFGINVNSYVIVFRITLDDVLNIEDFYFLSPSVNNVYVNEKAIYLIRTYTNLTTIEDDRKVNWPTSKVLIINIEEEMKYDGLIEVKGQISDRYWIDEYNGYLRIATTGTKYSYKMIDSYIYDRKSVIFNFLTIYSKDKEGKWVEVSSITEGIGEVGETLKSARFNGNTATLVTFKQTDPLYYIDLTDHLNPKITSELKISGFTVYQHPYKDNYVIGIGYESNSSGGTIGYKVALFDISDKSDIKQVGDAIVFSTSEYNQPYVINNPKELFLDLDNDIFGFRIQKSIRKDYTYPDGITASRYYSSCFKLFKINLDDENPLSLIQNIEKINDSYFKSNLTIDRMVFIKDKYYLLADDEVYIYQLYSEGVLLLEKLPLNQDK